VLLGEPPQTHYDLNFPLLGIPVRVHPLFWLVALILGPKNESAGAVITWIMAVFASILIHELGHALAMRAYGFQPWIVLHAMGGLTGCDRRYASRSKGADSLGQILISFAGPLAGFLLAAILVLALMAAGHGHNVFFASPWGLRPEVQLPNEQIARLLNYIFFISVFWGLINLLPIYPLDGGQIAREILLRLSIGDGIRQSLLLSTFAAGAMAVFGWTAFKDLYIAMFFGYLAYSSFAALQAYSGHYRG
jgi:Zn-dependent protease